MEPVEDDPDDTKILACALEGEADFVVSGDHHLTDIGSFRGIPIVNPDAFLAIMAGKASKTDLDRKATLYITAGS